MTQRPMGRFEGAAAVVTGGAHGIGRACVERLAAEGARVAVLDLDLEAAEELVERLPPAGHGPHLSWGLDVTSRSSVDRVMATAAAGLSGLDALVNVAGGDTAHGGFEETDDEVWLRMLDLNLLGVVRCCRAAVRHLRHSTMGPVIVTVSSVNALAALGSEAYSAAKAGVGSLTKNLAASLGPDGIRVNAVAPGWGARGRGLGRSLPGLERRRVDHRTHPPR